MEYTVDDIVDAIMSNDQAKILDTVNSVMAGKAFDALNLEKIAVAKTMFDNDVKELETQAED